MALKLAFATLRWHNADLAPALAALREAGWDGWEGRAPLDWLGTPRRLRRLCDEVGMPLAVYTASGTPEDRDWQHVERNKRRMEFAAEVGADCFMFMNGAKPKDRLVSRGDIERAAAAADEWAEYAAGLGLELSYHIHTNLLVDCIADWQHYMGMLRRAKLCIDVSHAELWGYDPVQAIVDFWDQLNYVHLQDYASCTCREPGRYNPEWVDVGEARCLDFGGVLAALAERGFARWVTACPGAFLPGQDDALSQARRSRRMRDYIRDLGY
ncbi:MAG: sugar phosphate isomerase/epimerase [Candidatus Latescibacterota bacterium]